MIGRFARIPVLQLEDGRTIVESGAILLYLAEGSPYLPDDPYVRAEVTSWLFFEQADLQKPLAIPRMLHLNGLADGRRQDVERYQAEGYSALEKLEHCLQGRDWLVAERYTVADTAVSVYVSLADPGGYDMERFTSIRRWITQVQRQAGWVELLPGA